MVWLYVPLAYAAASEDLTSASTKELDTRASEALARCAWWRGKRSPPRLWQRRWNAEAWLRRLSGLICEPSTLAHGVASWIASLAATPASRSAWPGGVSEQTTQDTFGRLSLGWSESAPPPSASSRTSPVICRSEDTTSPESFKAWATALRAHCGRRRKSARLTDESASSSLLPTPSACSYGSNKGGAAGRVGKERHSLESMARRGLLPTPSASHCETRPAATWNMASQSGRSLGAMARHAMWPTPTSTPQVGGQLNPTWVEWLMGWPLGWTACALVETASSQRKRPPRSSSSGER